MSTSTTFETYPIYFKAQSRKYFLTYPTLFCRKEKSNNKLNSGRLCIHLACSVHLHYIIYRWAASRERVANGPSRCHTKRRTGVRGHTRPSVGMTPNFSLKKKKNKFKNFQKNFPNKNYVKYYQFCPLWMTSRSYTKTCCRQSYMTSDCIKTILFIPIASLVFALQL